jgi:hypothetical protein
VNEFQRTCCSSSQHRLRYLGSPGVRGAKWRDVKLSFLDLVNECNTGNRDGRIIDALKPQHRSHLLLYATVILFDSVV